MRSRSRLVYAASALAAGALGTAAPAAHADPCSSMSHLVMVSGSSAVQNFLGPVAAALAAQTPPINVAYLAPGSCVGVGYMANSTPGNATSATAAITFDGTGAPTATGCTLDQPDGNPVDIGASDVFASSCSETVDPSVHDFHGPNQVMQFAVPTGTGGSKETSISAEAAYMAYGFGAPTGDTTKQVTPWNDPTVLFQRGASSGTQSMIAQAIGVDASKWLPASGVTAGGTSGLAAALVGTISASKAAQALGILAKDYTNAHTDTVASLAYQAYGQSCAYYPDSKLNSFDMANVRDGHYAIWGPIHLYAYVGGDGKATNPDAQKIIDLLSGAVELPGLDFVKIEATHGVVPDCAMHVSRQGEVGKTDTLASYEPPKSCDCKFTKEATGTAPAECVACTETDAGSSCPAARPHCNFGFCEVK